jgi:hypothetical protein
VAHALQLALRAQVVLHVQVEALVVLALVVRVDQERAVQVLAPQVLVVQDAVLHNAVVRVVVHADHSARRLHAAVATLMS